MQRDAGLASPVPPATLPELVIVSAARSLYSAVAVPVIVPLG